MRVAAATALTALLVPVLALGAGTDLGLPAAVAAESDKVTFTVGLTNEADSFNPFGGIEAPAFEAWGLMYDQLISYDMKDMSPKPGLADSWETSDDGLTWTFDLHPGVMWSDGEPLTARDVASTFNRIADGGYEANTWGSYLTSVKTVEAVDDVTVKMLLKKPNAVLPLLPIPILPEHIWGDIDDKEVKTYPNEPSDSQPVVGSGAFRFVEGTAGGSIYRFEANPDYWKGAPHIDEVVFRVFKNDDSAAQALTKGEIDLVYNINALQVKALEGQDGITAHNGVSPGFSEIAFNVGATDTETGEPLGDGNPVLQDPAFRHALGYAVDLDQIVAKAFQGAAEPGDTIVPSTYSNWKWDPPADQAFTFDLDKAGQLLDEAGYSLGSDGRRTMPDGSPIGTLRLMARSESKSSLTTMQFFAEWLDQIGIDSQVTSVESGKLTGLIIDGEYDAFEWGWYVEPDPDSMLSYLTCGQLGNWNDAWWCDKEYDALYQEQNSALSVEDRYTPVKRMQEIFFEQSPYLVTVYESIGEAVRSDRWACLQEQPDPGGTWVVQYGITSYLQVRPIEDAGDCDGVTTALNAGAAAGSGDQATAAGASDDSGSMPLVLGGVVLAVLVIGAGVVLTRRRATASDRE